jgi:hypothetical protein
MGSTPRMTAQDVRDILMRFLDETAGPYEWDNFISVPIRDPRLDAIRQRCNSLPVEFPPEVSGHYCNESGINVMRKLIQQLR